MVQLHEIQISLGHLEHARAYSDHESVKGKPSRVPLHSNNQCGRIDHRGTLYWQSKDSAKQRQHRMSWYSAEMDYI